MAASNTYLFLTDVLPRAIKKYGGVDPDALRKAALDVDLPDGGTMLGFGVKFDGAGPADGRPERARLSRWSCSISTTSPTWSGRRRRRQRRAGAAAAGQLALRGASDRLSPCWKSPVCPSASAASPPSQRVVQGRSGRDSRPDRPERLGQEHDLQHAVRARWRRPPARSGSTGARSPAPRRIASSTAASGAPSRSRGRSAG